MTKPVSFPRHLMFAAALICGVLLALAMHMLGQSVGLDLDGLWRAEQRGVHGNDLTEAVDGRETLAGAITRLRKQQIGHGTDEHGA